MDCPAPPPEPYGYCTRWHEGYGVRMEDVALNEAWVENDEGWANVVGPDFGCVLHEKHASIVAYHWVRVFAWVGLGACGGR